MAQEQNLAKKTGSTILFAAEEEFDRQIDRWGALLAKLRPEMADGILEVQDKKCNGSKPTEKLEIIIFTEELNAMQYLAARSRAIGKPSACAILKTEHNYFMERLAQAIKEAREQ